MTSHEMTIVDLGPTPVDYEETWALQRSIHADVVAGTRPDTIVVCQHEPVYTAGRRTASWDRPTDGSRVVDVDRGGRITWHGPGQLVAYPIIRLGEPIDVVEYVRALEQAVIDLCATLGLAATRVDGRSGVWFAAAPPSERDRKVAAIGVRVARGVTMHGIAINCSPDLTDFSAIVPCGLPDADVTSLTQEAGRTITVADVQATAIALLIDRLTPVRATTAQPRAAQQSA